MDFVGFLLGEMLETFTGFGFSISIFISLTLLPPHVGQIVALPTKDYDNKALVTKSLGRCCWCLSHVNLLPDRFLLHIHRQLARFDASKIFHIVRNAALQSLDCRNSSYHFSVLVR